MEKRSITRLMKRLTAAFAAFLLLSCPLTANAALPEDDISLTEDTVSGVLSDTENYGPGMDESDEAAGHTVEEPDEYIDKEALDTVIEIPEDEVSGPQYTDSDKTRYLMVGESHYFMSFENSSFDEYFPEGVKRTQRPIITPKGILRHSKKIDDEGMLRLIFKGIKPGKAEVVFKTAFKGGSYTTYPIKFTVVKPVLTKTKFSDITSLGTTINLADYVDGMEGFEREYSVDWSSSKTSVANVDENGLVTMAGSGTAKIKGVFTTPNNGKGVVSAAVTVKIPKLNKKSVTLIPGQKIKITLGNMPKGKTVDSWGLSSWGYKVRDDDYRDGLEKTENGNSCVVTAYMECGGTLTATVGGDQYVCEFTVKPPEIKKTSITLKKGKSTKIKVSGTKFKPNVFSYVSSDTAVATVDENGKVTAVGSGTAYIDVYLFQTKACPRDSLPDGGRITINVP